MDWFRWHHGSVTDPKFQLVAKKAGVRLPDVLAVWAFLLERASADQDRGTIGDIDAESLDLLFGMEDGQCAQILEAMAGRGLIAEGRIAAWDKRQPKREREDDTAAERKRRQRERDAEQAAVTPDVTPCHATSRHVTPREEEIREEKEKALSGKPDRADAKEVLEHLNAKTGRAYRAVDSNLRLIDARLKSGATAEQCKAVIDAKVGEWGGKPEMEQYLRPETLFGATKFEQYLGQLGGGGSQPAGGRFAGVK